MSNKKYKDISVEEVEKTEEEIVHKPKKRNFLKKLVFPMVVLCLLIMGLVGAYFIDQYFNASQTKKEPAKKIVKNDTEPTPGSSKIVNSSNSISLATDNSVPARRITVPNLKISFNAPIELRTGQELRSSIHDENNAQSVVRLYRVDTKYTKDSNGYDVADNTIIFSFDYPYGNDPIFSINQVISQTPNDYMGTISFEDSFLASNSARFTRYYDTQHIRYEKKFTDTYKAVVRMDVLTEKGKRTTVGMVYSCYDQGDPDLCRKTFQMFVSSVKIDKAVFEAPLPTYTEKDVFSLFKFKKKNLNSEKMLLWYDGRLLDEPFYKEEIVPAIAQLKDQGLQNIRCMPQQLFFDYSSGQPAENVGMYAPVISDPNLNIIIEKLKSRVTEGNVLTQFTACQTENKTYLIKYNINKTGIERTKDDVLYAKIAMLDDKGNLEDIVDIPNKNSYCSYFIALTKDNIIYFSCVPFYSNHSNGIDMYKINIANKEYTQVYKCVFPTYPLPDMSKYCQ